MNLSEYKNIWVLAEIRNGEPLPVYYELLSKAKELAAQYGDTKVCAVVLGSNIDAAAEKIAASGAEVVYYANHEKLADYNCDYYAAVLESMINEYKPESILIGATAIGSELAPTVAAKVKTGVAAHCVDMIINDDKNLVSMVPAFGGKIVSEILVPNSRPQIASVRPGILSATPVEAAADVECIKVDTPVLDSASSGIELVEFKETPQKGVKIEDAEVVICAGRGVGSEEAWQHVNDLAKRLGGVVAYSRAFIDNGFVGDESGVIGTSGKSIKPKVCLTFGVSGAMHFVCGVLKSKMILSVNRDENAKMFDMSDFKVVGDADKIMKALLNKLA